jgi:cytochrome c553
MTRLIVFVSFLISLIGVLFLAKFQTEPVSNDKFSLEQLEKSVELAKKESEKHHEQQMLEEAGLVTKEEAAPEVVAKVEIPLDTPELQRGYDVFHKSGKCTTCHGNNGEGRKSQKAPMVAGQYDWYLLTQLQNMKNKIRVNKVMEPYLAPLSDQDLQDVSHYLSKLPSKMTVQPTKSITRP